ncbi:MAG: glutamine amidotransferase [Acidimicrobiales bacterium]
MITVCVLFPDLLGTYGDAGNGLVVAERARRRGIDVTLINARINDQVPVADLYLMGGGEDGPQRLAADLLRTSIFKDRVSDGAHVVAVCAGLQILGETFCIEGNDEYEGLGIVPAVTKRGERRAVGELCVRVGPNLLVGFENHGGQTSIDGLSALGAVTKGRGNDGRVDGYRTKNIWATYAHGPVLAMNPWLADDVLSSVVGDELAPLDAAADLLYKERCRVLGS